MITYKNKLLLEDNPTNIHTKTHTYIQNYLHTNIYSKTVSVEHIHTNIH